LIKMLKNKTTQRVFALLSIAMLLSIALIVNGASALISQNMTSWYWTSDTNASAIAVGDVNGDNQMEIVSTGYSNNGVQWIAQLIVWSASTLTPLSATSWCWLQQNQATCVAIGDVNGDGQVEIVTGGSFFDGSRWNAQLIVWNGSTLAPEKATSWYWWNNNTQISSVAVANITGGTSLDIVTGGANFDGTRWNSQVIVWNGSSLTPERATSWFWTSDTFVTSVAVANVTGGTSLDIVTGGYSFDNTRNIAQLLVWNGSTLTPEKVTSWFWISNTVVNSVAVGNFTGGSSLDIVTAGSYNDGLRNNAQVMDWNGTALSLMTFATWFLASDTTLSSVAVKNIGLVGTRIIVGGAFYDNLRTNAQIVIWG
jgi:FG-GAP-like repeat